MASLSHVLGGKFDAASVGPASFDNSPLPPGTYRVEITNAELKELKSGNGQAIKVEYTVIEPEKYARRKVWSNLNIQHTSEKAQEIGLGQLSALCAACGIAELGDTDELFQRILAVRVKVRPAQGGYSESNEVVSWEPASATMAPRPAAHAVRRPATAAPPAMPWAAKKPAQSLPADDDIPF